MRTPTARITGLVLLIAAAALLPAQSVPSAQEFAALYAGDSLVVRSDQAAIQTVLVKGNLTAAVISNSTYPGNQFSLSSNATETYSVNVLFAYPGPYTASILLENPVDGSSSELPSFFLTSGELNLTIIASFQPRPGEAPITPIGWSSFYDWMGQFGGAFPAWIKVMFLVLGLQFVFVGYRWVKFEDDRRRLEGHMPPLDRGNKLYLWTDIFFRALLAAFAISLVVMLGEVIVILVARYLFLVDLTLVSLLDFFSLFFVAALGSIVYLARQGMDRLFDLKPMMED